jgi:hypothetical protein
MSLNNAQSFLTWLNTQNEIKAIHIVFKYQHLAQKFGGNISRFFRALKNGLYSTNGVSNRRYFKGLSGRYYYHAQGDMCDLVICYDSSVTPLNNVQVAIRVRKLLGYSAIVTLGNIEDVEQHLREIARVERRIQTFGDLFFSKKVK